MLVLLLLVLLSSSAVSDTRLPLRQVFRGACLHMPLPAFHLGFIALRHAEALEVSWGPSGTCLEGVLEVSICIVFSTTVACIATYKYVLCGLCSIMCDAPVAIFMVSLST